ncbi:MAG: trypsin-like peptidase domain-containing protein [Bdellovibrionales bacterium]|nr:trypsin-like peptidase domain-containing protein [Bdellovibrionales bacterium]
MRHLGLVLGAGVALASCSVGSDARDIAPPSAVMQAPAFVLRTELGLQGTATQVGDACFITNRHMLPPGSSKIILEGYSLPISQLGAGDYQPDSRVNVEADNAQDWVVFAAPVNATWPKRVSVDFSRSLTEGDEVWIVGYGSSDSDADMHQDRPLRRSAIRASITSPPWRKYERPELVNLRVPGTSYPGLSGSPVIIYDREHDRATIVAIWVGCVSYYGTRSDGIDELVAVQGQAVRPPVGD